MTDKTQYKGWFTITDQTMPADSNYECSCGVLIWDIPRHVEFHQLLGQVCKVERQA